MAQGIPLQLIGIDAATQPSKVGLAIGSVNGTGVHIEACPVPTSDQPPGAIVADWLRELDQALVAIDAPLGWPDPLRDQLPHHVAGRPLPGDPSELFKRQTDLRIRERLKKNPLEVAASWMARTAHAALRMLESIERHIDRRLDLAWEPQFKGIRAIEVYPAATLAALELPPGPYKRERAAREQLVDSLERRQCLHVPDPSVRASLVDSDHALDAALCVFTAGQFLAGRCLGPAADEQACASREGWIWCPGLPGEGG